MKKIVIGFLLGLFLTTNSFAVGLSHVPLATYWMAPMSTANLQFLGQKFRIAFISGTHNKDLTALFAIAPNFLVFDYYAPAGIGKYSSTFPYDVTSAQEFYDIRQWAEGEEPPRDTEDGFLHFASDYTFTSSSLPNSSYPYKNYILVDGFGLGVVPGHVEPGGTGTLENSRIPCTVFSKPIQRTKTISGSSGAVRSSNIVTITTTVTHYFDIGDMVVISGVDNASFNGTFEVVSSPSSVTFTYAQIDDNATSQNGTVTQNTVTAWLPDWVDTLFSDFISDYIIPTYLVDSQGNKVNGLFMDAFTAPQQHTYWDSSNNVFTKADKYDSGTVMEWLNNVMTAWLDRLRAATSSTVSPKTGYIAINGDNYDYILDKLKDFYHNPNGNTGPDFYLSELGLTLSAIATAWIPRIKEAWLQMDTYGKKIVMQAHTNKAPNFIPTWTNYSGNIYYTDDLETTHRFNFINIASGSAHTNVSSLGAMTTGTHYVDPSLGRLYIWLSNNANPTGQSFTQLEGGEKGWHGVYAQFMIGFLNGQSDEAAKGFFHPHRVGYIYELAPNNPIKWFESLNYDVGSPVVGGIKQDGNLGTDIWDESCETSSKMYLWWQGDGATTYDDDSVLLTSATKIYARKFTNGYFLYRYNVDSTHYLTNPKTFTIPFTFKRLRANNSLDTETDQLTLRAGEGVFLITDYEEPPPEIVPSVIISSISSITTISASASSTVTDDGGGTVSARGVCWNTSGDPTTSNSKTEDGSGTGAFASSLTGLSPGTTYYVRAYATNEAGTAYSGNMYFKTPGIHSMAIGIGAKTVSIGEGSNTISW